MQRWISILLGLGAIALAAVVVSKGFAPPKPVGPAPEAGATANVEGGLAAALDGGLSDAGTLDIDGSPLLPDPSEIQSTSDGGGIGSKMPDGTPVPALPQGTPATVRFGVILVQYQGSQAAKADARPKQAGKELADKLAEEAQKDFAAAVKKGDPGSLEDVGHIKRGILEPASEYILFTLPKGGVSQAFDTPRGFWIVKRID